MAKSHRLDVLSVLRSQAKALGYDIYGLDDDGHVLAKRFMLAKRIAGGRREVVLGKDGGVTLDTIERWLDESHPP
jgi:hypothetical protein